MLSAISSLTSDVLQRKFTTTSETAGVSPSLIVMTESGDVTNAMLKDPDTGLFNALKDGSEGLEYLESLVISDMPLETPDEEYVTLSCCSSHKPPHHGCLSEAIQLCET